MAYLNFESPCKILRRLKNSSDTDIHTVSRRPTEVAIPTNNDNSSSSRRQETDVAVKEIYNMSNDCNTSKRRRTSRKSLKEI